MAERPDLLPYRQGVGAALVPAAIQVGLERVQLGRPALPLPAEEVLRSGCAGEGFDGTRGHAELAADRPPTESGGQQFVDNRVAGSVRSAKQWPLVQDEPDGSSNLSSSGADRAGSGTSTHRHPRWSATQRSAASLKLCRRCHLSATCTAWGAPAVAPGVGFRRDQDGPVVAAFAGGVLIDADDARGGNSGSGKDSTSRSTLLRLTDKPRALAMRAPARPASARPTAASVDRPVCHRWVSHTSLGTDHFRAASRGPARPTNVTPRHELPQGRPPMTVSRARSTKRACASSGTSGTPLRRVRACRSRA